MQNYGNRIREARLAKGYTQTEAAQQIGVIQQAWQRLEGGKLDPRMSTIAKVCELLNVSADWIMGLDDQSFAYTTDEFESFYMKVIDLVCMLEDEELISNDATNELINGINKIKSSIG